MILVLLLAAALAEEPDETVVVEPRSDLVAARRRLDEAIRGLDYLPGAPVRGRTVYMPRQIWEPAVVIDADGHVKVHGHVLTPYLILPSRRGVAVKGLWGSAGEVRGSEREIVEALEGPLREVRAAEQELALAERIFRVEEELAAIVASEATWPEKRDAIVSLWLDTADNGAGARVRARIERFVAEEVQEVAPFTEAEIAAANARRGFVEAWGAGYGPPT